MKIGICALNIPQKIYDNLFEIQRDKNADIFWINHKYKNNARTSIIFKALKAIEAIACRCSNFNVPINNLPVENSENVDLIICWQTTFNNFTQDLTTPVWTFWLNDRRFDDPLAGLASMIGENTPISLSIKSILPNESCVEISSVQMRRARTFSRTREIATAYFAVMLKKCLGNFNSISNNIGKNIETQAIIHNPSVILFCLIIENLTDLIDIKSKKTYWKLYIGYKGNLPRSNLGLKCISPPNDRFWADPFLLEYKGIKYIFIEEYLFHKQKGIISVLELRSDGEAIRIATALEESFHLSYPNVFFIGDDLYMIPETGSQNRVQLYECIRFPDQWKKARDLLNGSRAADTTVFYFEHTWWIFTSVNMNGLSQNDQLFIYFTDDLLKGTLTPHAQNPAVFGAECSRMAGNIFKRNGKLYRPAQDCSKVYGGRIVVMEIDKLTPSEYMEHAITVIEPEKGLTGLHTYNECTNYFIVDAY